ncbi:MAG: hypothetical protein ACFCUM_17955 [Bacteroidales bacterium]
MTKTFAIAWIGGTSESYRDCVRVGQIGALRWAFSSPVVYSIVTS